MPTVTFTQAIQQHVAAPPSIAAGSTVREALETVFAGNQALRSYLLDDQGALRKHLVVFVDGVQIADRARQSDPVAERSRIHVMQALSGG
jgi:sulfur carrier protein ThiS